MNNENLEEIKKERKEFEKLLEQVEKVNNKIIENDNYFEAQKEAKLAENDAIIFLRGICNSAVSLRTFRPDDIKDFTAGTSGTSKTMGENDTTVATGTTENTFFTKVPSCCIFVIEGIYLPKASDIYTDYIAMYIGDAKQRWYRGSEITCTNKHGVYFREPLLVKSNEKLTIKFLTTLDGLGTGKAKEKHQICIKGKVFKSHKKDGELIEVTEKIDDLGCKTESIIHKLKNIVKR